MKPKVICLCGSTKFVDRFDEEMLRLTEEGNIVLTIGTHDPKKARARADNALGNKQHLDDIHKRKIDLADEIFVLNVGGYIGDSTKSEINYAGTLNKPVKFLEEYENFQEL